MSVGVCPICDSENSYVSYAESIGVVEYHYVCANCGFFDHMIYGPTFTGIDTISGTPEDRARKESLAVQYAEKIEERHLEINPECMNYM